MQPPAGGEAVEPRAAALRRTFRSLRERNYRLFFAGHAVSVVGTWMQRVGQDWLVLQLSDSAVALGVTLSLQFTPTLVLGLWGGVLADRLDRRRLIVATQTASAALAGLLAILTLTGAITLWMVYALALGLGLVTVVDSPARLAFVTDLVEPDDYVNAQALNSTVHNLGRFLGPAVAGTVIASVGVGWAFVVNALSFLAVLLGLARMDASSLRGPASQQPREAGSGGAREGLRYVRAHPDLRVCLVLVGVVALFGQNFRVVLPVLAREELAGGASTYGWLTSALGMGAVLGALASAGRSRASLPALVRWTAAFGLINLLAAAIPNLALALAVMLFLGLANITFNTLARSLLQLGAEPRVQGRVIALHSLIFLGSTPLGAPLLGWVCQTWGARAGFLLAGATALVAVAVLPRLRRRS